MHRGLSVYVPAALPLLPRSRRARGVFACGTSCPRWRSRRQIFSLRSGSLRSSCLRRPLSSLALDEIGILARPTARSRNPCLRRWYSRFARVAPLRLPAALVFSLRSGYSRSLRSLGARRLTQNPHIIQLVQHLALPPPPPRIPCRQQTQAMHQAPQLPTHLVILVIVLAILDVVPAHHLGFAEGGILFPLGRGSARVRRGKGGRETYVEKVDFFEELFFVMLQLTHGG